MNCAVSRSFLIRVAWALTGCISLPCMVDVAAAEPPRGRPNVVFILIDDMGFRDLGCFGGKEASTPEIDRMAAEGLRINRFYVSSPICSPSRVALTTGQYPNRWRITSYLDSREINRRRGVADWLDPQAPSLARFLQRAGYYTAHVGKWHMGGQRDVADAPEANAYGFETSLTQFEGLGPRVLAKFEDRPDGTPGTHGPTEMSARHGHGPIQWVERHRVSEVFVDHAIAQMRAAREQDKPFYINLWLDDVHTPCQPRPELRGDGSKRARYLGVLREVDRQVGRLMNFIRNDQQLRQQTLVLLCSDNGPEPEFGSAGELRGHKANLFEGGIRSPLIVWWPGGLERPAIGTVNDRTVIAGIDLPPSLLALAGASAPAGTAFDGIDMSEALTGRGSPERKGPLMWVRPPDRPGPKNSWPDLAIREGRWKLLTFRDGSRTMLFDVEADPNETRNLAGEHPRLVERLRREVIAWEQATTPRNPATRPG